MILTLITFSFFVMEVIYFLLLFIPKPKRPHEKTFSSLTVLVPAYNEEENIEACIDSLLRASFKGKKEIIVINDGSTDNTLKKLLPYRKKGVVVIDKRHSGKADSLNAGLKRAKGKLVAVIDGDSIVSKDAFEYLRQEVEKENVAAACGVVKVKNRKKFLGMWLHIEQLYNSFLRFLLSKINANIVTPGPLSLYRKDALQEVKGFSVKGFSEDVDISIRLIRAGYSLSFSQQAISETVMPYTLKGFIQQRFRFVKGTINIFKKHLKPGKKLIDIYTLPMFVFIYVQAVITGLNNLYQILSGYFHYFVRMGVLFNLNVLNFFFDWLSLYGFVKWAWGVLFGSIPLSFTSLFSIIATTISYFLLGLSIFKYDKKIGLLHVIPAFFMFPFWLVVSIINILAFPEFFVKEQKNIWEKQF